jgi:hypothetical protein
MSVAPTTAVTPKPSGGRPFRRVLIVTGGTVLALWVFGQLGGLTPIREGLESYAADARAVSKKEAKKRDKAARKRAKAAKKAKPVLTDHQKRVAKMVAASQANMVRTARGISKQR